MIKIKKMLGGVEKVPRKPKVIQFSNRKNINLDFEKEDDDIFGLFAKAIVAVDATYFPPATANLPAAPPFASHLPAS